MGDVAAARDAAALERDSASAAMERLRKSLDAFQVTYSKPFAEMSAKEKAGFLLTRFGIRRTIEKVTARLSRSPVYKAMLQEQAAKRAAHAKKRLV